MRRRTLIAALIVPLAASGCIRARVPLSVHATKTFPAAAGKLVRFDARSLDVDVKVDARRRRHHGRGGHRRPVLLPRRGAPVGRVSHARRSTTPRRRSSPAEPRAQRDRALRVHQREGHLRLRSRPSAASRSALLRATLRSAAMPSAAGPVRDPHLLRQPHRDRRPEGAHRQDLVRRRRRSTPGTYGLEADTSSGDVTLESGSQRAIVGTSSGDVRLEQLQGGLSVDTSSGEVAASWSTLAAGATVRVHTSSGDVRLRDPRGLTAPRPHLHEEREHPLGPLGHPRAPRARALVHRLRRGRRDRHPHLVRRRLAARAPVEAGVRGPGSGATRTGCKAGGIAARMCGELLSGQLFLIPRSRLPPSQGYGCPENRI